MTRLLSLVLLSLVSACAAASSACDGPVIGADGRTHFKTPIAADYRIGNGFGFTRHPLLNIIRSHEGIDLVAPMGTPVRAPAQGEIIEAARHGEFGNYIRLRHRDRVETEYAHLQKFASGLAPGNCISEGEVIGFVGTTGLSTGPHLHLGVRIADEPVDPVLHVEGLKDAPRYDP